MIELVVVLVIAGVILFYLESLPMTPPFKTLVRVVIILFCILYLIRLFGLDLPIPRVR